MKSIFRWVYIALVGLIVFTGALFIAQGALSGNQQQPVVEEPALKPDETPQTDDDASPTPERMPETLMPEGPVQFI